MKLELLLKLNDQVSRGTKAALTGIQREARNTSRDLTGISTAANRIRTAPIERMTRALRQMQSVARSSFDVMKKGAQIGAGVAAGGYVLKSATERPMAYDRRLALLSNTAFSDEGVMGRIKGKSQIHAGIRNAVNYGGGTPEQAADTLNTLIGSGALGSGKAGLDKSMALLPMLQKSATGTGTDPNDLARIAISAIQNMGLSPEQIPAAIAKGIRAGQEGGFELKDMARWLPQQMSLAAAQGMKGMPGFESLLAANQVGRITAGTSDEAGNNLVNLLAKMNSPDTINDFKKQGIDLTGSLAKARGEGVMPLEAFAKIVESVGLKDKNYVGLKNKAAGESGADRKTTLNAMADLMMQKGIGKVIQDRQAMMELLGLLQQKEKYEDVRSKVNAEGGREIDTSSGTVMDTSDYKAEQVGNKAAFATIDALKAVDGPLKRLLDGANAIAVKFPGTAAAASALTIALTAAAAAATGFSLLGGRKLPGMPGGPAPAGGPSLNKSLGMGGGAAGGAGASRLLGLSRMAGIAAIPMGIMALMLSHRDEVIGSMTDKNRPGGPLLDKEMLSTMSLFKQEPVKVIVSVENGNIVAAVNKENSRQASRK